MSEYKIITISRQFGSGGHEIGEKLAARLGIPLYDRRRMSWDIQKKVLSGRMNLPWTLLWQPTVSPP